MKKRIVSLLLTVVMLVSVCCVFASAAPYYRYDYDRYYYYDYDRFSVDLDVDADGLCCESRNGNTLTAYVDEDTDEAVIDVDTTGRCSVKVTKDGKTVRGYGDDYEVSLDKGWNTVKVTVTANKYYYYRSPLWLYQGPVVKPEPSDKPEGETEPGTTQEPNTQEPEVDPSEPPTSEPPASEPPASEPPASEPPASEPPVDPSGEGKPVANSIPDRKPAPQRPVVMWKPYYKTSSYTNTYYVKIYRGDTDACGHVPCKYVGCGKHLCNVHACYDLGTVSSDTYKITAITNQGGGVSCADAKFTDNKVVSYLTVDVVSGTGAEINIIPQTGYTINKITVDGVSVPLTLKYTFSEVTADHTIAVEFAPAK